MGNIVEVTFRSKDDSLLALIEKANKNLNTLGTNATQTGIKIDAGLSVFKGNLLADFFQRGANQALGFAKSSVAAFNEANNAALGLQSIARFKAISSSDATDAVKNLDIVKAGLISIGDASTAVKSLLSAGFGLPQSIEIVKRFGDSAAFGRQSALSFGEAIRSAAEGVKNGNSVLVDNAGVTKNLSVILKERGFEMQDLNDKIKGAANGIIGSNISAVGNLIKSASELAKTDFGKAFTDALPSLGQFYKLSKDIFNLINGGKPKSQESFVNLGIGTKDLEKREADLKKLREILKQSDGRSFEEATNSAFNGKQLLDRIDQTEKIIVLQKQQIAVAKDLAAVENARGQGKTLGEINRDVLGGGSFSALKQQAIEIEKALNQITGASSKALSEQIRNIESPGAGTRQQAIAAIQARTAETLKGSDAAAKLRKETDQIENAINNLRRQTTDNPLVNFYTAADQRQRTFFDNFKTATFEQKKAFEQFNKDVLNLDIFKGRLAFAATTNNLQLELAKLQAGLGGIGLRDEATRNAAERAAIIKEIETRRGAGDLTGAQQYELEAKLAKVGIISRLDQLEAEFRQKGIQSTQSLLSSAGTAQEKKHSQSADSELDRQH